MAWWEEEESLSSSLGCHHSPVEEQRTLCDHCLDHTKSLVSKYCNSKLLEIAPFPRESQVPNLSLRYTLADIKANVLCLVAGGSYSLRKQPTEESHKRLSSKRFHR